MKYSLGVLPSGKEASVYTISGGNLTAHISDLGAALVRLYVPDASGNQADVVLGFDCPEGYLSSTSFMGATVGRNANRTGGAAFLLNGRLCMLGANDNSVNNLHSGPDYWKDRIWTVAHHDESSIRLTLLSPDGDQGFPGSAEIHVTYSLRSPGILRICYDAICDQDTVFNLTNHSYFNLAGHDHPEQAMQQVLTMPARVFCPDDALSIPTGELRSVEGTPFDFRVPKAIGKEIGQDYDALKLQGGYDHNFEVFTDPCAILTDPGSGRSMAVSTDCPGVQFYSGNFLSGEKGKDGVTYPRRSGVCLETQFYPDSLHHPDWKQPVTKADTPYHSQTEYRFF